jgi:hypothetical protein
VSKLRCARERIRERAGNCEGRKSYADPELVAAAKRLHRWAPKGGRRSLREIASELETMGYTNKGGALLRVMRQVDGGRAEPLTRAPDWDSMVRCFEVCLWGRANSNPSAMPVLTLKRASASRPSGE